MKNQKGLGLIAILFIIGALIITAGGVMGLPARLDWAKRATRQVWEKKIKPAGIPILTPTPTIEFKPTGGKPVAPGISKDVRDLPTTVPFDIAEYYCRIDADCYDEQGKPKGICEVPCQGKAVCRNGLCVRPGIPGMR